MPIKIKNPTIIQSTENKPKIIKEFIRHANSQTSQVSIAQMVSPGGWEEPGQKPEFDEYTTVLKGTLRVQTKEHTLDIHSGEAVITQKGEWVKYSTPLENGAEYIAVCLPAFSPINVHRDEAEQFVTVPLAVII